MARRKNVCLNCGACCDYFEGVDVLKSDNIPVELTTYRDGYGCMKQIGTRCIALSGTVGKDARCSIYENRPSVCRDFPSRNRHCADARREHHLRVLKEENDVW